MIYPTGLKTRLLFCLTFFGLIFGANRVSANTFNWTGTGTCQGILQIGNICIGTRINTTDWNNADNWTGGTTGHLVPIAGDAVFIGVNNTVTNMPVIGVTGTAAYACASITFGNLGPQTTHSFGTISNLSLTINTGNTLTVTSVTQNLFPGVNNNPYNYTNTTILGGGTLTCTSFTIGDATTAPGVLCQAVTRVSIQTPLIITGDVTLNSNGNGSTTQAAGWGICFPYFSVEKGTTQLRGQMKFAMHNSPELNGINLANSAKTSSYPGYGLITADNTASSPSTFELQALVPIVKADNFYVFFTYGGNNGTVLYDAPSGTQTIYTANEPSVTTSQTFINAKLPSGVTTIPSVPAAASASYYNLTFSGGTKAVDVNSAITGAAPTQGLTVGGALLNNTGSTLNCGTATPVFYGNYTNSGTFTAGTSATFFSGATAQALFDNSAAGTAFKNVTFNGGGTKTMSGTVGTGTPYPFSVSSAGVLTMGGTSQLVAGGVLTLISDASGSANVDVIPTGSSIAGNVNVQRYMSGGAGRRGYRLMSSPVYTVAALGSTKGFTLQALQKTTPITGWGVTGTYSATPPANAFDPAPLGNPSAFFYYEPDKDPPNSTIANSDYKALSAIADALPVGNGFLFFFRGDRSASAGKFLTTGSPEITTLNNTGTPNQGDIPVYIPTNPLITYSGTTKQYQQAAATATLSTTFSKSTTTSPNTDGFHLVGNPYACTIDLEVALNSSNFTAPANPTPTANNYIYALNNSGAFGGYLLTGTGATGAGAGGITRWIASGQGFFIKGTATSTLTFHEACKVTTGYTLPTSFAIAQNSNAPFQVLHINLMLDSAHANETVVQFGYRHASNKFSDTEDAPYITGPTQTTYLTSYSSDNVPCLINQMNTLDSVNSITLYAAGPTSGRYTLSFSGAETLDPRYKIFLKDSFLKDSLDLSVNTVYQFNLDRNNPKTFGDTRFSLVVHPTHIQDLYQLTTFDAIKYNNSVQLNWKAAHEGYYTDFKVQRSIDGGKTFTTIGDVQSDASGMYGFSDTNPVLTGTDQYRIFQTVDSTVTKTSGVVTIAYTPEVVPTNILKVYPNPAATTLNVVIKTNEDGGPLVMRIYNMKSQLVLSNTFGKDSTLSMEVSKLITGTYVIHVTDSNKDYGSVTFTKL
ncbi:MAG: hypothetical protein JWR50_1055 [Mucilaginibacter sp.]|nr:hypothetical protein [Mucilaginibacter sp.]